MIESTELLWRGRGNAFTLHTGHSKKPILNVEPDATYSGMWRVHWPDGAISDMTNLSRAKDAATRFAETAERRKRIPAEVHRSPVVRSNEQTDLRYGQRR
jgi:hypothetical protein